MLGPVTAEQDTARIALSGTKMHTVLATLLLDRGEVVSDDRLTEMLWGWEPPATRNAQIYTYVSRLRRLLGGEVSLIRRQPGYQLVTHGAQLDIEEFQRLARLGQQALTERRYHQAGELLRDALDLWQGQALANVTPQLAEAELPYLEENRAAVLEHRIDADLELGRHRQLVSELTDLVGKFPMRERLRAQLMTALYRSGRQADALHVYHAGRKLLAEELGVDPGSALNLAFQGVLNNDLDLSPVPASAAPITGGAVAAPVPAVSAPAPALAVAVAARERSAAPAMLPPDAVGFTGREPELRSLAAALAPNPAGRPRRVLLTGMAGVGKTALAVRAAHAAHAHFPDGQLHASLCHPDGTPKDPGAVLVELLRALGEPGGAEQRAGDLTDLTDLVRLYRSRTAGRRLLILLDNAVSCLQVDALLPNTPEAAVLITSQTPLVTVTGRHIPVRPLPADDSLALLAEIAGPERIAEELDAARELAAYCGGLPLALRILGSRLAVRPHWTVARLAQRLHDPSSRLRELRVGDLDVARSLQSSMWRLPEEAHDALRRLALLGRPTFSRALAATALGLPEEIAEEVLEDLADAALLDTTPLTQYRMHPLVRLFAHGLETRRLAEVC
ncbi:NB-ARC domain-containing protein [Streptomyces sp. APSN-46.1]|uniref:AfsR/SARP family transcriptional regulator n=1 Tax=Streptomyces sp. APSN-46.1 TaxID=2929049 RepID=UPI001FB3C3EB|nr:AfsR/SARP family transcriptional regulator [Streptomyces sp. APSN-46.1]MCJ1678528.1 NB-ARC domain-containing protein [Streptomyces sp. APSN-46.1]